MGRVVRGATVVMALAMVGLVLGCEDDDRYRDAPRVEASRGAAPAPGGPSVGGGVGPVSGMELPPGHPPIGEAGQADRPPAPGGRAVESYGVEGPILWEAPEGWTPQPPANEMRFAQYGVAGGAEGVVFYFGPDGAGGVEANLDRWAGQFTGGPAPEVGQEDVEGMRVHRFDGRGTYDSGMAMGGGQALEDHRMLGAIAETEAGPFFFRLLGPEGAVGEQEEAFESMVASFRRGEP